VVDGSAQRSCYQSRGTRRVQSGGWRVLERGRVRPLVDARSAQSGRRRADRRCERIVSQPLPLSGITVLDLSIARAGPTAVRHLADWGADIIRVEHPAAGKEELIGARNGPDYQNLHRNKLMIQLDLKSSEGHDAFMRLVKRADVLIENMRVSVKHRLKIAWDD